MGTLTFVCTEKAEATKPCREEATKENGQVFHTDRHTDIKTHTHSTVVYEDKFSEGELK